MYDAFISYSRTDLPSVQALKQALDQRRLSVFLDSHSLRAGRDWAPQLGGAVGGSRMMVLCWSAQAAASEWVRAEIHHCISSKKPVPVLPWLLDNTPLPAMIAQTQGVVGTDPKPVVAAVERLRNRHRLRQLLLVALACPCLASALWLAPRLLTREGFVFRGHVVDDQGKAVAGAVIAVGGVQRTTGPGGDFQIPLPGSPGGAVRVVITKPGFGSKSIETQSDVPDLGVVLEKAGQ